MNFGLIFTTFFSCETINFRKGLSPRRPFRFLRSLYPSTFLISFQEGGPFFSSLSKNFQISSDLPTTFKYPEAFLASTSSRSCTYSRICLKRNVWFKKSKSQSYYSLFSYPNGVPHSVSGRFCTRMLPLRPPLDHWRRSFQNRVGSSSTCFDPTITQPR